jgi:hypothetical protein
MNEDTFSCIFETIKDNTHLVGRSGRNCPWRLAAVLAATRNFVAGADVAGTGADHQLRSELILGKKNAEENGRVRGCGL